MVRTVRCHGAGGQRGDDGVVDVQASPVRFQGAAQPVLASAGEPAAAGRHVDVVGVGLLHDGAHLVDGVARAHHEPAAALAQSGVESDEAVREEGVPVRRRVARAGHGRIPYEQGDDLVPPAQRGTQGRMVVDAEVRGEQDDRDVHGTAPGMGSPACSEAPARWSLY